MAEVLALQNLEEVRDSALDPDDPFDSNQSLCQKTSCNQTLSLYPEGNVD